jgi:hypothetical protein
MASAGSFWVNVPRASPLWEFEGILCITAPNPMAGYTISFSYAEMDPRFADQWRATVSAIFQSFQVNQAVVNQEANAIAAPAIANIHAIGEGRDQAGRRLPGPRHPKSRLGATTG